MKPESSSRRAPTVVRRYDDDVAVLSELLAVVESELIAVAEYIASAEYPELVVVFVVVRDDENRSCACCPLDAQHHRYTHHHREV
jgi:hypothetical protein